MRMGGEEHVADWAARQRAKALHVGTYEAAVHNLLRRMCDQADRGSQFYLYRVRLDTEVVVRTDWVVDPSNWLGDVVLDEVCPAGVDVARYLNYHEDPGGLSLALGRGAIVDVQQVAVPLPDAGEGDWIGEVIAALESASDASVPATGSLVRFMQPSSPRAALGGDLGRALAGRLPVNLQDQFASGVAFDEGDDPARWARRTSCLFDLIMDPGHALAALDKAEHRQV